MNGMVYLSICMANEHEFVAKLASLSEEGLPHIWEVEKGHPWAIRSEPALREWFEQGKKSVRLANGCADRFLYGEPTTTLVDVGKFEVRVGQQHGEAVLSNLVAFADAFHWALIPWSDDTYHRAYAFITSDGRLHEAFLQAPPEHITWPSPTLSIPRTYEFNDPKRPTLNSVVMDEYVRGWPSVGHAVWDTCRTQRNDPLVLYPDYADLRSFPCDDLMGVRSECIRRDVGGAEVSSLHRILDAESFSLLCQVDRRFDALGTAFVPGNAELDEVSRVCTQREDKEISDYSEVHTAPHFLRAADWWYAMCVGDSAYSFFSARDPKLTAAVASRAVEIAGGLDVIVAYF